MEIIGHRGLAINHVENTIGAFKDAFEAGADAIELDVHLTTDLEPVVFHDFDLKRILKMDKKIFELSLREIKNLTLGNGDKIPTLSEVLKTFKDRKIYVELKTIDDNGKRYNEALPEILYQRYKDMHKNLVFISFDPVSIMELRSYSENFSLGLDYEDNSKILIPYENVEEFLIDYNVEYFIPDIKITDKFLNLNRQIKIAPWVVNNINDIKEYKERLSGIISDRCDLIINQLK